jgi:hypothetical protein
MTAEDDDFRTRLAAEAARVRTGLGRSDLLIRLFDFLLQCSLAGRAPKEIEIGQEVFGRGTEFDALQDASVRVYAHRLRKKLDEYYADKPAATDRLIVPRGEYRLKLADAATAADLAEEPAPAPMPAPGEGRPASRFWMIVGLFAAINAIGWLVYLNLHHPDAPAERAAQTALWKPLSDSRQPTTIVTGDYYIFGEAPDKYQVTRLVREFSVNSRDDLDTYLMAHPDDRGRYVDVDLHYLPVSVGSALRDLLPIIDAGIPAGGTRPAVMTMSQLPPTVLKGGNIVYVGFLSGLGILRDPLFGASGFKVGDSYDELIDKKTGRHFDSDWGVVSDGKTPHRDYAYLARLPGPNGNHLLVIAGTRDAAVMQAAEIASDQEQLTRIAKKAGEGPFEALYEVHTLGNQNLGSDLVLARPLPAAGIWQPTQPVEQNFPDQPNTGGGAGGR